MNLKIKTETLQTMVGKVSKCVSNNKLIPLTSLLNIRVENNILVLTATNATNYFYVSDETKYNVENFEISVMADTFTKLVQKTTSEYITLDLDGAKLKVKGNGTYTMELPLDENGDIIRFPKKLAKAEEECDISAAYTLKLSTVKNILAVNKASLADNMELPVLTCYYCGDSVITSDRKKICKNAINVFETPLLITSQLMELLGCLTDEDISVHVRGDNLIFSTMRDDIYAPITEGIETFPVDAINSLCDTAFESNCKISKSAVLNVIDRLSLFVSPYDKKGIYLTFNNEGLLLSSKKSSGEELVPYLASENFNPFTCCIDIEMFKSQISTHTEDEIDLYYGLDQAIKLVNNNVTQIIALIPDDRI